MPFDENKNDDHRPHHDGGKHDLEKLLGAGSLGLIAAKHLVALDVCANCGTQAFLQNFFLQMVLKHQYTFEQCLFIVDKCFDRLEEVITAAFEAQEREQNEKKGH